MADEEEEVTCPVCGGLVNLEVTSCPHCGAEFENEGVEEIVEVEEEVVTEVPGTAAYEEIEAEAAEEEAEEEEEEEEEIVAVSSPTNIADFRVLGAALVVLGIIGVQISLFIDWYWGWVPPIEDNLGMFLVVPVVVLVIGVMVFVLVKKALSAGRKVKPMMPGAALTVFLVGVIGLVLLAAYKPLNDALQDSQGAVAGVFAVLFLLGVFLFVAGSRVAARASS